MDGFWEFVEQIFDWLKYDQGKAWVFLKAVEMRDRTTDKPIGARVYAQCVKDTYAYKTTKKGYTTSPNIGYQVVVPVLGAQVSDYDEYVSLETPVRITDVTKATYWNNDAHIESGKVVAVNAAK